MKILKQQKCFEELLTLTKRIKSRYLNVVAAQKIFDELNNLCTVAVVGEKQAQENADILKKYNYFFGVSKEAVRCFFLIELAKFFDEDNAEKADEKRSSGATGPDFCND